MMAIQGNSKFPCSKEKLMNIREKLLGKTFVYKTFKNFVAPPKLVQKTIEEFLHVPDGASVLDLGCGYGDIASYYAGRCSYLGIDSNESYIVSARKRNSDNDAQFIIADISDPEVLQRGPYDLVLLTGVLHHLPNEHVSNIVAAAMNLVGTSGRFVAIEPVFSPDQRLTARLLIASDRGRYVRDLDGYTALLSQGFKNVKGQVVHGRLRIPYSHAVLTCSN
jgi:2-polyprenyl-3-methyl-5-hydroxy-6-metoxy-1,4-benzoquinol methylase